MSRDDDKSLISLVYSMPDIVYKIDQSGNFTFLSNSICKLDYEPEELLGRHFSEIIHPEDISSVQSKHVLQRFLGKKIGEKKSPGLFDERRTGKRLTKNLKVRLIPKNKKKNMSPVGELNAIGIYDFSGESMKEYAGTIGIIRDISIAASSQKALLLTEKFYRHLIDNSTDILAIISNDGTILFVSNSVKNTLGYEPIDLIGENIFEQSHSGDRELLSGIFNEESPDVRQFIEHRVRHISGKWIILETHPNLIFDESNKIVSIVLYSHDITERKHAEESMKKNLGEKELLLKEIHHRVKNNFQLISSLISLQAMNLKHPEMISIFRDLQNRIIAMSLIHEKLYQSDNIAEIDFSAYIESLINELSQSYNDSSSGISIKIDIDRVYLSIDKAIPCGLIINELFTNAFKYAFPAPQRDAVIGILLTHLPGDMLEFIVYDNGVGIPDSVNVKNAETLGLTIVNILADKQLKGSIDIKRNNGTTVTITFPK